MKELTVIFFCSWKFALTFPLAIYSLNLSFSETLLYTNLGGIVGLIFFSYLSQGLLVFWQKHIQSRFITKGHKQNFTTKRRRFIYLKNKYGLPGIILLNPIILSIPISTFLVIKYFGLRTKHLLWLFSGQLIWSIIYTFFYFYLRPIIF